MSESQHDVPPGPPPPGPPPGAPPQRRLQRSRTDRVVAGVCGGLGEYFDIDPVIFRIAFVVLVFVGGAGVLLYPAAWILLPEEGHHRSLGDAWVQRGRRGHWVPLALIVIGALILSGDLLHRRHGGGIGFAVIAIVIGVLLLRRHPASPPPSTPSPWTPAPPPPAATEPATERAETATDDTAAVADATEPLPMPSPPPPPYSPPPAPPGGGGGASWGPDTTDLRPPKGRSLSAIVLSVLLIGGGAVGLLHAAGALSVSVTVFLAAAVIFVGLALVVSAWTGGSGGLIAIGVVLTVALAIASVVHAPLSGGWGKRHWVPSSAEEVRTFYKHGAGDVVIDLSHVTFPTEGQVVRARLGVGLLRVVVPQTALVTVKAHAGAGDIRLFDRHDNGLDVDDATTSGTPAAGTVHLILDVGAGQIDVDRGAEIIESPFPGHTPVPPPAPVLPQ
ncbi:MAG: PspC domain-containing protein [Acidimicrobiia bacterium]|nr:PspC domain-containing protein [Acidimicrobiia bacterium]